MPESVTVNTQPYYDLTEAFATPGVIASGIYYGLSKAMKAPSGMIQTVQYAEVAYPGTFDGVGTVELGFDPGICMISFAIVGTLPECATKIAQLNAVLVRSDAARYTVTIPSWPSYPGCKLFGKPNCDFEDVPLGGKVLKQIVCLFKQLSYEN